MIYDVSDTNQIMRKVFPNLDEYIMNSMTPSLSDNDGKTVISMLVLGNDFMIQDFKADKDGKVRIDTTCYIEENEYGIGKDLIIRFDFYYKTGHPIFETVIMGDLPEAQEAFIKGLNVVDKIYIWIADNKREVFKIMEVNWGYNAHKEVLDMFKKEK